MLFINHFLFYYNLPTLSWRNWKGLAAKQAEKKEKKNRGARCRYRFTVPQILASIFKLHHTSFRINKIVAHPLFVFQVSRPDSSSPGQGIIAVIRDTVRACTIQEADCCFPRVDGFMHTCCAGPCIRVKARVKRSYVASNRAWNSRFPFPIELKSDANRRRFHPEINWFDNFFFIFSDQSSRMNHRRRKIIIKRESTRDGEVEWILYFRFINFNLGNIYPTDSPIT